MPVEEVCLCPFDIWILAFVWNLVLEIWDLFVIWCLGFGIYAAEWRSQ